MQDAVATVLAGEYECGYFGRGLKILDVGANVGAFTIWANLRWPQSSIHAYEPHPATFAMLHSNTRQFANIEVHHCAVFPSHRSQLPLRSRYPGDGESGLVESARATFIDTDAAHVHVVPVLHPRDLPSCDILKVDVEGAEADIFESLDVAGISLVLLEYQNDANRKRIKARLERDFSIVFEDSRPWSPLLINREYRRELRGDHFGHLFFVNRRSSVLERVERRYTSAHQPSLRQLVRHLPTALRTSFSRRWRDARSPRAS